MLLGIDQRAPGEHPADRRDDRQRQVREVAEVLVVDLAALTVGAAQQVGGIDDPLLALRLDCGYVSFATAPCHRHIMNDSVAEVKHTLWLHLTSKQTPNPLQGGAIEVH